MTNMERMKNDVVDFYKEKLKTESKDTALNQTLRRIETCADLDIQRAGGDDMKRHTFWRLFILFYVLVFWFLIAIF